MEKKVDNDAIHFQPLKLNKEKIIMKESTVLFVVYLDKYK